MGADERVRTIFREHAGILRGSEAVKLGIHRQTLSRMLDQGVLERPARGLYVLAGEDIGLGNPELVQVARLVPRSVFSLISALSFHGLTTQIPYAVYIALPKGAWKPRISTPRLEIVWLSDHAYQAGIEKHAIETVEISVYSIEKTIADCFKFRTRIGEDVAIEALGEYLKKGNRNIGLLIQFAEILRVRSVMEPFMKALA